MHKRAVQNGCVLKEWGGVGPVQGTGAERRPARLPLVACAWRSSHDLEDKDGMC